MDPKMKTISLVLLLSACMMPVMGQSLQQQKMCADQAQKTFEKWKHLEPKRILWDYGIFFPDGTFDVTSHYNVERGRCFVLLRWENKHVLITDLQDAFERKSYGVCVKGNPPMGGCFVKVNGKVIESKTPIGFDQDVQKYFGFSFAY